MMDSLSDKNHKGVGRNEGRWVGTPKRIKHRKGERAKGEKAIVI